MIKKKDLEILKQRTANEKKASGTQKRKAPAAKSNVTSKWRVTSKAKNRKGKTTFWESDTDSDTDSDEEEVGLFFDALLGVFSNLFILNSLTFVLMLGFFFCHWECLVQKSRKRTKKKVSANSSAMVFKLNVVCNETEIMDTTFFLSCRSQTWRRR